jgi:ketosteroid isomerase-like protein
VAGYSSTPLPQKLGIKEGQIVGFRSEPETFRAALGELPDAVTVRTRVSAPRRAHGTHLDLIVAFFTRRAEFERGLDALMNALDVDGSLWIAWPKGTSGVATDMTEDVARDVGVANGMVDNKVCAIDDVWSGLRLVHRKENRPVEHLRRIYSEWARGNFEPRFDVYAQDMEWGWSGEFPGMDGVSLDPEQESSSRLREWLSTWEEWRCEAEDFISAGDSVVALTRYTGRGKGGQVDVDTRGAHLWTFRNGRVIRLEIFSSRDRALQAAGLPPGQAAT